MMPQHEIERMLTFLMDRRAIEDVIARYTRGVDRLDRDAIMSVYHEDAIDDHGCFVGNREEFFVYVDALHRQHHHSTMHMTGNITAEIAGDTAHVESYYLFAAANKVGSPFTFVGGRYLDRMEKRDGRWAIIVRKCLTDWVAPSINHREASKTLEGRANFLHMAPHEWGATRNGAWPKRDRSDPSYERPLTINPSRLVEWHALLTAYGISNAAEGNSNDIDDTGQAAAPDRSS